MRNAAWPFDNIHTELYKPLFSDNLLAALAGKAVNLWLYDEKFVFEVEL
jgi:hypothetical protein